MKTLTPIFLAVLGLGLASTAHAAQRTFVSTTGNDANTASNCGPATPCRGFAAALTVTDVGGEILAVGSGGYGPVALTKSVSIIAAPGVYAGVSVFGGSGITIATAGVSIVLRGLTINGLGGSSGVSMTNGTKLSVENCVISNFTGGQGIDVNTAATVRVVDSLFRDNSTGISVRYGATADISNTKLVGNAYGIWTEGVAAGTTTTSVSDSVVTGSGTAGIAAVGSLAGATARTEVIRTTVSNGGTGVLSQATAGTAVMTLSESMVTGNTTGLAQSASGGTATFNSLTNNTVSDNGTASTGTITPLAAM
ncbi:MAG: right-handed parallel beta-helix repeat-containing protein [Betaproteobacteria bacterium]|nr:right-handed parallel beta-helix repeat-containing protein [Betaproteobacteria bacterium]